MLTVEDANANSAPPTNLAVWRPSTGDFDGEGKTDFSVFRPAEGNWYVQRSSDNSLLTYNFGISGDLTAQADYDDWLDEKKDDKQKGWRKGHFLLQTS